MATRHNLFRNSTSTERYSKGKYLICCVLVFVAVLMSAACNGDNTGTTDSTTSGTELPFVTLESFDSGTEPYTAVTAGGGHTCGLRVDETVECWGYSRYGQVEVLDPTRQYTAVTAGDDYTCGLSTDKTIQCWGVMVVG